MEKDLIVRTERVYHGERSAVVFEIVLTELTSIYLL